MIVRFAPLARRQFLEAVEYMREDSPRAAQGMLDRASAAFSQLSEFPESGYALPEFPDLPHREVLVDPYRFFYRVVDDTVWIVGAWHVRQLPGEPDDAGRG